MPKYETKLKLGRKLDDVDNATASDNQVSVLFRYAVPEGTATRDPSGRAYDEAGADKHISLSIESDSMKPDDVAAILALLERRGVFTKMNSKVWVSQPQASEAKFGATTTWQGTDISGLAARAASMTMPTVGPTALAGGDAAALAKLREAERRVGEVEKAVAGLKDALTASL